jgi:hypothetical protein
MTGALEAARELLASYGARTNKGTCPRQLEEARRTARASALRAA